MEADKSVKGLLDKLSLHAVKYVLEFEGSSYNAGDFSVKVWPQRLSCRVQEVQ